MKILAIETSSEQGSLALQVDGGISFCLLERGAAQSESALRRMRALLLEGGIGVGELDAIAFGIGPGMFTGLRLGCGLAQGLAIGSGVPLVAVSSLQALAERCTGERVVAATDARMGEIYFQCFERAGEWLIPAEPAHCVPPEQFALPPETGRWCAVGPAFAVYRDRFDPVVLQSVEFAEDDAAVRAQDLLAIAARRLAAGQVTPPERALPEYVRDKVALTTRERLARGARA